MDMTTTSDTKSQSLPTWPDFWAWVKSELPTGQRVFSKEEVEQMVHDAWVASAKHHESVAPEPVVSGLPTEPGFYASDGLISPARLTARGEWIHNGNLRSEEWVEYMMPLSRLYDEAEVREARAVAVSAAALSAYIYSPDQFAAKIRAGEL